MALGSRSAARAASSPPSNLVEVPEEISGVFVHASRPRSLQLLLAIAA